MDKVAKATVGSKCEHCGTDVYVISAGLWVHTLNGISRCPDKSAPSKWALERALKFNGHIECKCAVREGKSPCGFCRDMALEFDAIARERDEVTEKLEEFLEKLNGKIQTAGAERILANNFGELAIYFSGDEIRVMRKALAAYRERMGR